MSENQEKVELEIPSFEFAGDYEMSFEDAEKEAAKSDYNRFLKPGLYDMRVTDVKFKGLSEKDNAFGLYQVTLEAVSGGSIKHTLIVPMGGKIKYGEKGTLLPFMNVKKFFTALGADVGTGAGFQKTIKRYLGGPDAVKKLIGKEIGAKVGYRRPYVGFLGKTEDGTKQYTILTADGQQHQKFVEDGAPITWGSWETAQAYAEENGVKLDGFVNVLDVLPVSKN